MLACRCQHLAQSTAVPKYSLRVSIDSLNVTIHHQHGGEAVSTTIKPPGGTWTLTGSDELNLGIEYDELRADSSRQKEQI